MATILYGIETDDSGAQYFTTLKEAQQAARVAARELPRSWGVPVTKYTVAEMPKKALYIALLTGGWAQKIEQVDQFDGGRNG